MKNEAIGRKVYGEVCLRKQRKKRQKLLVKDLFLDYAKNSTLHGLRYITERALTMIEKWFWIATFILSVCLCSHQIIKVYFKWQNSPVIVTVSERFVSAAEVPFPSVTICPQIKSRASVYHFSEQKKNYMYYDNATKSELEMLEDISTVCKSGHFIYEARDYTNSSIIENISRVAPTRTDVFWSCMWRDRFIDCSDFRKVYTSEGLCYSINSLAANEMFRDTVQTDYRYLDSNQPATGWSVNGGYTDSFIGEFPMRGIENGAYPDLTVILHSDDLDNDAGCNGMTSGYKIYIQHPTDFPQSSMYYYAALHGQVSSLAVSFNQFKTSEALEGYSSDERQCLFSKDRDLFYFKIYTMKNCRAECLSNYTYAMCGCVGYYMPHNNSSEICSTKKHNCMTKAHYKMASTEIKLELAKSKDGCNCLPACDTIEYEAEILKTDFNITNYLSTSFNLFHYLTEEQESAKYSSIEMYFKKPRFVSMRRSELFGLTDFLANIGGLLGVFLGFSFLSLVEILYFATLRVGFSLKHDLNEEKRISQSVKYKEKY